MTGNSLSRSHSLQKAKCHFHVVKRFTDTFTYDELFPDVTWDEIPQDKQQIHAKCLVVATYLAMGEDFMKLNSPRVYIKIIFEEACLQLQECLEIDPDNWYLQQLLHKCELGKQKYDEGVQQIVSPSSFTALRRIAYDKRTPTVKVDNLTGKNLSRLKVKNNSFLTITDSAEV
jgi:hypothetical protein